MDKVELEAKHPDLLASIQEEPGKRRWPRLGRKLRPSPGARRPAPSRLWRRFLAKSPLKRWRGFWPLA